MDDKRVGEESVRQDEGEVGVERPSIAEVEYQNRYEAAMHAVQTGVLLEIEKLGPGPSGTSPKHLRVGINAAMVSDAALVQLLVDKKLFSMEEYWKYLAEAAETEKARYELNLRVNLA